MRAVVRLVVLAFAVVACSVTPAATAPQSGGPVATLAPTIPGLLGAGLIDPAQCAGFGFSPRRCRALARAAADEASVDVTAIQSIELRPAPTPQPGRLGGGGWSLIANVRFVNGNESIVSVGGCGGIGQERTLLCTENPVVYVMSPTINGYRDIPCADENGGGCATALPAIDATSAGAAVPLRLASRDIPIDHTGKYEIALGSVTLPNGILSNAAALLADDHPDRFIVTDGVVWISLKSRDRSRPPFDNYYDHGWWPGTEQADVTLTFAIEEFESGAVLQIRDLVVE